MTVIKFSVDGIDQISPKVASNYGARSLAIECTMNYEQMLALLTQIQEDLPDDKWAAWLNEEC